MHDIKVWAKPTSRTNSFIARLTYRRMKYRQLLDNTAILRHRNIDIYIYWYINKKKRGGGSLPRTITPILRAKKTWIDVELPYIRWSREYKFIKLIISIIDLPPHLDRIQVKYKPLFLRWETIFLLYERRGLVSSISRSETRRRKIVEEGFSKNERKRYPANAIDLDLKSRWEPFIDPLSTIVSNETPCT